MVEANAPWHSLQHCPRQPPDSNCMSTLLETGQQECLPSLTNLGSCKVFAPVSLPGSSGPRYQSLTTEPANEASGRLHGYPFAHHSLRANPSPHYYGLGGMVAPNASFTRTFPKGFFIFDQSENRTRPIYNYLRPCSTANARLVSGREESNKVGRTAQMGRIGPTKNMYCEGSDAKDESEMREDTEEINALLDSEDDETSSDDEDCEDDEVTSTGHSPIQTKRGYQKQELADEPVEEVASSDGPNKRLKKLDGGYQYNESSPMHTASTVKLDCSHEYDDDDNDDDAKSSCADGPTGVEGSGCTFGNIRPEKDKIQRILRVLESIIPGAKGIKDPLLVIDEAIDYLSIAKIKAETLGLSSSVHFHKS